MSKPAKAAAYNVRKAFVDTAKLKIYAKEQDGRITSFEVTIDGVLHVEHVKGNRILNAFKRVEQLTKNL